MAYSYDDPLIDIHLVAAAVTMSTQTAVVLPTLACGDLGNDPNKIRQPRVLANARVLGIAGVCTTAGTGQILIGDGTTAGRYGTITIAAATVGNSITSTIELTEEGCHMGVADVNPATSAFTLTFSGTALVVANMKVIFGHW